MGLVRDSPTVRAEKLHGLPAAGGVFGFKDLDACDETVRCSCMDPAPRARGREHRNKQGPSLCIDPGEQAYTGSM